ncbi:MAG: DUF4286 family protein [Bacteroidota bacterium]
MLIYQVQITIEAATEKEWLHWMKTVHVPDVLATGLVAGYDLWKDVTASPTYCFNYYFLSDAAFATYQEEHAPILKAHPVQVFPGKFTASRRVFHAV